MLPREIVWLWILAATFSAVLMAGCHPGPSGAEAGLSSPSAAADSHSLQSAPRHMWLIEATGHDYVWRFRYAGDDNQFDTLDDLVVEKKAHLPINANIVLQVKSDDFVYSFSAPELGLRKIAVPELTYTLEFRPAVAGTFDIVSDPMCGARLFHDEVMGRLVIEPYREFREWRSRIELSKETAVTR